MALITCPECGGKVSDQADVCIHCGFPLKNIKDEKLFDVVCTGFTNKRLSKYNCSRIAEQLQYIVGSTPDEIESSFTLDRYVIIRGLTKQKADWVKQFLLPYGCIIETPESDDWVQNNDHMLDRYDTNVAPGPICPRCGAMAVTTGSRGYSIMTGFWGSGKTVNRCSQCGYKWNP